MVYETKLKEDEDERELKEAFRVLDKDHKGVIPVTDLRYRREGGNKGGKEGIKEGRRE